MALDECLDRAEAATGMPREALLPMHEPASARAIVIRMLNNLKGAYLRLRDFPRAGRVIGRLMQLCPGDVTQRRDLGAALLQAGRPGQAIDHLRAYLDADPPPEDHRSVGELLVQARGEVARWN